MTEPNYFTCSLGQAAELKRKDRTFAISFETVIELIDGQAEYIQNSPAVGFARFKSEERAPACAFDPLFLFGVVDDLTSSLNSWLSVDISTTFRSIQGRISSLVEASMYIRIRTCL